MAIRVTETEEVLRRESRPAVRHGNTAPPCMTSRRGTIGEQSHMYATSRFASFGSVAGIVDNRDEGTLQQ
jgi:hypothetical protein